jgi:hypothetical protein
MATMIRSMVLLQPFPAVVSNCVFLLSRARPLAVGHLRYSSARIKFRNKIILRTSRSLQPLRRGKCIAIP